MFFSEEKNQKVTSQLPSWREAIDPRSILRPSPGSSNPTPESKSLLVLFFRKEQNLLLSSEKEAKRLLLLRRNLSQ
jgi:hypothetical protein